MATSVSSDSMSGSQRAVTKPEDWTELHWAVWCQDLDQVKALATADQHNINTQDRRGWTPLHLASTSKDCNLFSKEQVLIRYPKDSQLASQFNSRPGAYQRYSQLAYTYSMYGSCHDPEQTISFFILLDLLHAGGDAAIRTHSYFTALHFAASSGWLDHFEALRFWGASIHDSLPASPAFLAVEPVRGYLMSRLGPEAWQRLQLDTESGGQLPPFDWQHSVPESQKGISSLLPGSCHAVAADMTPPTCASCTAMSLEALRSDAGYRHSESFYDLQSSARTCSGCHSLYSLLSRFRMPMADDGNTCIVLQSSRPMLQEPSSTLRVQLVSLTRQGVVQGVMEEIAVDMFTSDKEASVVNKVRFGRIPLHDTRTAKTVDICATWLRQCEATHTECCKARQDSQTGLEAPARLLDVSASDGGWVRIVSGSPLSERYAALSHRWVSGPTPSWATTTSNIEERQSGFEIKDLPASCQDAILITKSLGIRFLWIDSLCIIQDSRTDWKSESAKMLQVFGSAAVTIFSDSAVNDDDNFLKERAFCEYQQRLGVRFSVSGIGNDFDLCLVEQYSRYSKQLPAKTTDFFQTDVVQSDLSSRGWIFQEQVVSARRLHFGSHQMYWGCRRVFEAEDGTNLRVTTPRWLNWLARGENMVGVDWLVRWNKMTGVDWAYLVENYTSRSLSRAEDRYIAISSLAEFFGQRMRYSPRDYLAGSWSAHMHLDLLWAAKPKSGLDLLPTKSPTGPTATDQGAVPSWSWVGAAGPVEYPYLKERTSTTFGIQFDLQAPVQTIQAPGARHFGDTSIFRSPLPLTIHGVLERDVRVGRRQVFDPNLGNVPPWARSCGSLVGETVLLTDSRGELVVHMIPDVPRAEIPASLALLTAWTSYGLCPCSCQSMKPRDRHCIVLVPCPGKVATYRRIGYAWYHCRTPAGSSSHYEPTRLYYEKWTSPKETFRIV